MFSISASASADWSGTALTSAGTSVESRALRRAPAALAGDDLEAAAVDGPHEDRLHHAVLANRLRRARRATRRPSACAAGTCRAAGGRSRASAALRSRRGSSAPDEQRVEAAAQSLRSNHRARPPLRAPSARRRRRRAARGAVASIRRSISPASARYACAPFECLVEMEHGNAVRRRLGEAHVARDRSCDRACRRNASRARRRRSARACCAGRTSCAAAPRSRARGLRCARTFLIVCTRSDSPSSA